MDTPFYAAYPWPLNEIIAFWDNYFAQANAYSSLVGLHMWFLPQQIISHGANFSDFGRA